MRHGNGFGRDGTFAFLCMALARGALKGTETWVSEIQILSMVGKIGGFKTAPLVF